MGAMGRMTMNMIQSNNANQGSRIGPSPIGDEKTKMIPTYRLYNGADVNLEIIRANLAFFPESSRYSSANFIENLASESRALLESFRKTGLVCGENPYVLFLHTF